MRREHGHHVFYVSVSYGSASPVVGLDCFLHFLLVIGFSTDWLCKRVEGFRPERLSRWLENGDYFEHVLATNGLVRIDLSPYADVPAD